MMQTVNQILQLASDCAGLAAIFCLLVHIIGEMQNFWRGEYDRLFMFDKWAWAGLLLFTLWMACQVGRIGW